MFNAINMMDPELIQLAQEQMSRMSPADLAMMQQQMQAFPELMKFAQQQISRMSLTDMAKMQQQMQANPEFIKISSESLKNIRPEDLRMTDECIREGSKVQANDAQNVKALYRRGQAYKELGQLEGAVSDLSLAHEISPNDETIADALRDGKEKLGTESSVSAPRKLVIEEINEDVETVCADNHEKLSTEYSVEEPEETRDMLKVVSNMMTGMAAEDLQKMFGVASSMTGRDSSPTPSSLNAKEQCSSKYSESHEVSDVSVAHEEGEGSYSGMLPNMRSTPQSIFPASAIDFQEQMRNQLKEPAMQQMLSSMMKCMSPDLMASMSEQFGLKLSREDAEKAHQAMSSMSPDLESLDKMMLWMDRIQRGVEVAKRTKNWLVGNSGLILTVVMLIVAVVLYGLGFIGV